MGYREAFEHLAYHVQQAVRRHNFNPDRMNQALTEAARMAAEPAPAKATPRRVSADTKEE